MRVRGINHYYVASGFEKCLNPLLSIRTDADCRPASEPPHLVFTCIWMLLYFFYVFCRYKALKPKVGIHYWELFNLVSVKEFFCVFECYSFSNSDKSLFRS